MSPWQGLQVQAPWGQAPQVHNDQVLDDWLDDFHDEGPDPSEDLGDDHDFEAFTNRHSLYNMRNWLSSNVCSPSYNFSTILKLTERPCLRFGGSIRV